MTNEFDQLPQTMEEQQLTNLADRLGGVSNDSGHVDQKNQDIVRRAIGQYGIDEVKEAARQINDGQKRRLVLTLADLVSANPE